MISDKIKVETMKNVEILKTNELFYVKDKIFAFVNNKIRKKGENI